MSMVLEYDENNHLVINRLHPYQREDGQWIDTWYPKRILKDGDGTKVVITFRDYKKELERVIMSKSLVEKIFEGLDVLNTEKRMEKLTKNNRMVFGGRNADVVFDVLCMNIESVYPLYRRRYIVRSELRMVCFLINKGDQESDYDDEYPDLKKKN